MSFCPGWKSLCRFTVIFPLWLALAPGLRAAEQFAGESAKWRLFKSAHFEMFSAARDGETRELLHKLEMLRSHFYDTLKVKEREPKEVTIYYFNNEKAFKSYCQLKQRQDIAGFYLSRPDRGVIVLSPAWDDGEARAIIFHEYIHHLNRAIGTEPPLWYNEGVAELFSTIEFEKDGVVLGTPLSWHIQSLRDKMLLPMGTLFAVDYDSPIYNTGQHSGQFYAQSWALMHYWQFGKNKLDRTKVDLFIRYAVGEAHTPDPALLHQLFKETMGMDYEDMQRELEKYVSSGYFFSPKLPLPKVAEPSTYESRPLSLEEIRERLADLGLRVNEQPAAKIALLNAAATSPTAARIWEVLGTDAWMQGEVDLAKERWEKALEAGSLNPAIFHELGQIAGHRWFANFNYFLRLPPEKAEQLRALYKRSIASAPEQSVAYELLAWVEASVEKPDIANVNLVQSRYKTLHNKARTVVAFALVRVRMGDSEGAKKLLTGLDKLRPDYWTACAGEAVLARLEDRPQRIIEPPAQEAERQPFRLRGPDLPGKK